MAFDLIVNGTLHTVDADPQTPLLWVIRDHVGLTGTKFSCGIGRCGACTLHVDGRALRSCSVPAAQGAFGLGFWMPQKADAQATSTTPEINAWIVIAPDDMVTIRIAQTELGQGVWTSNAMMVCEELQCDWAKVRPEYASVNRDGQEMAPEWTLKVMGKGATDPFGGGEPQFGSRERTGSDGLPHS